MCSIAVLSFKNYFVEQFSKTYFLREGERDIVREKDKTGQGKISSRKLKLKSQNNF